MIQLQLKKDNKRKAYIYLKRDFKFSGSSVRPAYPGFIVIQIPTVGIMEISSPWKTKRCFLSRIAS